MKEEEEYRGAIDRYLRGNADMSLSSSNEVWCQFPFLLSFPSSKVSNGTVQSQLFIWSLPFYCSNSMAIESNFFMFIVRKINLRFIGLLISIFWIRKGCVRRLIKNLPIIHAEFQNYNYFEGGERTEKDGSI
jgi:hypothetical protein